MPPSTPPAQPRRRKNPQQRRDEIHAAAVSIAEVDGLQALTLRAIAQELGVASGLVAHYFPRMDQLVTDIYSAIVGQELAEMIWRAASVAEPLDRLARAVRDMIASGQESVTLVWVDAWSLGRRNPQLAAAVREQSEAWVEFLAGLLADAGAADASTLAWQLLGIVDGLNAQSLAELAPAEEQERLVLRSLEHELGLADGTLLGR